MNKLSQTQCFGGSQRRYSHFSVSLNCEMKFSIFLPNFLKAQDALKFPVIYWLSGLTCTDENFMQKSGAQKFASELGLILVAPDTSPRGDGVPDDKEGLYDFGLGAGFYLNATQKPWEKHYQMYDYIVDELPAIIESNFPIEGNRQSIMGHSMGGHGALTIALKNPDKYHAVSAFAPIASPMNCPWGIKAFRNYLGEDKDDWLEHDSAELIKRSKTVIPMLVDQGSSDEFIDEQLKPNLLLKAARERNYPLTFNSRLGYDHSYFFVSSFIEQHLKFHADR
ncbi:MAG: S-formylglutathione hydrolase [Gammaproteobacteria bacterium]|nr:S-formylglutathione hydrolase [Gammaproteobacteria bacterium]